MKIKYYLERKQINIDLFNYYSQGHNVMRVKITINLAVRSYSVGVTIRRITK